jgi:uncharacterized protein DUF559
MTEISTVAPGAHLRRDLVDRYGEHAVRIALRDGLLEQPWRGVIITKDRSLDLPTRAAGALLAIDARGVLSGPTAAALHGCSAADDCPDVHVTVPYESRCVRRPGLVVHNDRFEECDVVTRMGLRVFVLDLVIAELLCTASRRLALACMDQALAALPEQRRRAFRDEVGHRLATRDDRRGTRRGGMLLDLATGKADSPPESWLRLLVVDARFPVPEAQFEVRGLDGELIYLLDMAWPELRIALEYDGYEAHEGRAEADELRDRRLAGRGWIVIRARAQDLRQPKRLIGELRAAFWSRGLRQVTT